MSVVIEKGAEFLGVPLIKVRNVLHAWRYGGSSDAAAIAQRTNVSLDPRTVMVLLEELRDRGLIGSEADDDRPPFDGLTDAGKSLAWATARKRTSKERAWRVLNDFLDACSAVNAREDLPFDVREVWLFGSLLDPAATDVADVDLVLETGQPKHFTGNPVDRFKELARELGGTSALDAGGILSLLQTPDFVKRHFLHGGRRNPLLSFAHMPELRDLACPCQLLFDAAQGGRVSAPPLERHPKSTGRSNRLRERRRMPDLTAGRGELRPVLASLARPGEFSVAAVKAASPWPEDDFRNRIVAERRFHLTVGEDRLARDLRKNVVTKRLDVSGSDDRRRSSVIAEVEVRRDPEHPFRVTRYPSLAVVFDREIHEEGGLVRYAVNLTAAAWRGRYADHADVVAATWWVGVLLTADVERILRRDGEDGLSRFVSVEIEDQTGADVGEMIVESLAEASDPVSCTRERISSTLSVRPLQVRGARSISAT
jgi:hypothetical protein